MDVWTLYLSSHNGKQPRNAFDLVNFSRSTDHTLSFKKAKQIYQENIESIDDIHSNGNHLHLNTNDYDDDEPHILKSPKHPKKRRISNIRNAVRRNSKLKTHKTTNSKSNHSMTFNDVDILKESDHEDTNYDEEIHKMYNNGYDNGFNGNNIEGEEEVIDNDSVSSFDSEDEYRRKRRSKNQSSPVSLNIKKYKMKKSLSIDQNNKRNKRIIRKPRRSNVNKSEINKIKRNKRKSKSKSKSTKETMSIKRKNSKKRKPKKRSCRNKKKLRKRRKESDSSSALSNTSSSSSSGSNTSSNNSSTQSPLALSRNASKSKSKSKSKMSDNSDSDNEYKLKLRYFSRSGSKHKRKHKRVQSEKPHTKTPTKAKAKRGSMILQQKSDIRSKRKKEKMKYVKYKRSSSADPGSILNGTKHTKKRKKLKPRPARHLSVVTKKERRKENSNSEEGKSTFRIGDVVQVSLKIGDTKKKMDLARIRYYGITILDPSQAMFGIECFKFQFNSHKINGNRVLDGSINGNDRLFEVKKAGYGTFIRGVGIKSSSCLWNFKVSKHALKLSSFDGSMFIRAAKYGSLKVIKHLFKILLCNNNSNNSDNQRSRSRSGSTSIYNEEHIATIQTSFGYAVLYNHTKIVKMILTHCGSNNNFNPHSFLHKKKKKKKKTKSLTDYMIRDGINRINNRLSMSSSSSCSDSSFDDECIDDGSQSDIFLMDINTISKFYTADLFDLVIEQKNFKMFQILIEYDSWPLLSPSSQGLFNLFCKKGYLKWIKYLLEISPYIVNMPLLSSAINSTMITTSIIHARYEYTKYILSNHSNSIQVYFSNNCEFIPILLVAVMSIECDNLNYLIHIIELILAIDNNVNFHPEQRLKDQQHLSPDIIELIDEEYCDHFLIYYNLNNNNLILGSLLSALIYKSLQIYRNKNNENKDLIHNLSEILSLFMLNAIDFEVHNEYQHIWIQNRNIKNFPYNICDTKQEFNFLQKMFKKSLKKYPIKLLNLIESIFTQNHELIFIFKKYIIPYSIYDTLIFESLHYAEPIPDDISEPESVEFMFAYQRSPVVVE